MALIGRLREARASDDAADIMATDYVGALVAGGAFPFLLVPAFGLVRTSLVAGLVNVVLAGGAVLASLADTLMPEAFEHGRPLNAFATAAGFFLSFVLAA